jgi:hypothetical protein
MKDIIFEEENAHKDSLMVTPIGICLSFYAQSNNFIFVAFNGEKLKLYDNGHLTVSDAAVQMSFPNEDLFPKRGKALTFTIGGKTRIVRGTEGESSVILINGEPADLYTQIHSGDEIEVKASTPGEDASFTLGELTELKAPVRINVNSRIVEFPKKAVVNGKLQDTFYKVSEGDDIKVNNFYTVEQIAEFLDVAIAGDIKVNSVAATADTKVYEDFNLEFVMGEKSHDNASASGDSDSEDTSDEKSEDVKDILTDDNRSSADSFDNLPDDDGTAAEMKAKMAEQSSDSTDNKSDSKSDEESDKKNDTPVSSSITVIANGRPYTLTGKLQYVFVDIFDKMEFDLKASNGRKIVTLLNGRDAQYLEPLKDGDVIEVRWEANR